MGSTLSVWWSFWFLSFLLRGCLCFRLVVSIKFKMDGRLTLRQAIAYLTLCKLLGFLSLTIMHWKSCTGLFCSIFIFIIRYYYNLHFYYINKWQFIIFPVSNRMGTTLEGGFSKICAWIMFSLGNVLAFAGRWSEIEDWKHTCPLLGQIVG